MSNNNELIELVEELLKPIDVLIGKIQRIVPPSDKSGISEFRADLAGMLAIAICANYENCIKEILRYQASLYHSKFEDYIRDTYEKLNSKIAFDDLNKYAKKFDKQLSDNFKEIIKKKYSEISNDNSALDAGRIVEKWNYKQLLDIRHNFAHSYKVLETLEVIISYHNTSKDIILAFAEALSQKI